eukprot:SAG31_NODE_6402_length_2032_cov_1.511123_2_plen_49_part_00
MWGLNMSLNEVGKQFLTDDDVGSASTATKLAAGAFVSPYFGAYDEQNE